MSVEATPSTPSAVTGPRAANVAHAWLSAAAYSLLEREAADLGLHPDALTAKIVAGVLRKGWTADVLDR